MTAEQGHELDRVTRLRAFRCGLHDLLVEVHLEAMKKVTDKMEAEDIHVPLLGPKTRE